MPPSANYAGLERRLARPSPRLVGLAVLALAAIAYATLCPIGLRPHFADANVERFGAYLVLGGLVALAAGRRVLAATAAVVLIALALEAAQHLVPGRHGVVSDALVKALGGVAGVALAQFAYPLRRRLARAGLESRGGAQPAPVHRTRA
jgi:hypothetical protein